MQVRRFAQRVGIVVSLSAAAMALAGSPASAVELDADGYPIAQAPPIIIDQVPPVPPPEVELPSTGSSTLQTSLTIGGSAAALGAGLVLVARRRREAPAALSTVA